MSLKVIMDLTLRHVFYFSENTRVTKAIYNKAYYSILKYIKVYYNIYCIIFTLSIHKRTIRNVFSIL